MRSVWLGFVLAMVVAMGSVCHADDNSCGKADRPSTYQPAAGDVSTSTRLEVTRSFDGTGELEINVCTGELRVERAASNDQLRVSVVSPGADTELARYLQDLRVTDGKAVVTLRIPGKFHPVVTVSVPSSTDLHSEVNLGSGKLTLDAYEVAGDRKVNVGAGELRVLLNGNRDYATLESNVGVGKLEDDRPGGSHSYGVSRRSSQGSGKGSLELNVGAGKVVLAPAPE